MNHTIFFRAASMFLCALAFVAYAGMDHADAQTAKKLKCKGCVTSKQLKNDSVKPKDLAKTAKPAGASFVEGNQTEELTATDTIIRKVSIRAPAAGTVIVNASGYVAINSNINTRAWCSITTGTEIDSSAVIFFNIIGNASGSSDSFGATRGFAVDPGTTTFNLVCEELAGDALIVDTLMTAIYVPQTY